MNPAGKKIIVRVEMWCARHWWEAREAGMAALAAADVKEYQHQREEERDWFAALLVMNRLNLGIEPLMGETFLEFDNPQQGEVSR